MDYQKKNFEIALKQLKLGLSLYCSAKGSDPDYVLDRHIEEIGKGLIGLLNGETGSIDCGYFDRDVRAICRSAGIDLD